MRASGVRRGEYGRLYGARHEAKFFAPASTKRHEATKLFREWRAEIEGFPIDFKMVGVQIAALGDAGEADFNRVRERDDSAAELLR